MKVTIIGVTVTIKMAGPVAGESEPGIGFLLEQRRKRLSPLAVLGSVLLHIGGIGLVVLLGALPTSQPVKMDVVMLPPRTEKLIWYVTKDRLPRVVSSEQQKVGKPRIELKRPVQTVKADAAQPGKQLIWQPAPKVQLERETPLPNLLAFVPQPARPEPRKFVPTERTKAITETPRVLPEAAPVVTAPPSPADLPIMAALPGPARPRPRDYVPPTVPTQAAGQPAIVLEAAPNVPAAAQTQQPSIVVVGLEPARPNEIPLPEGSRAARFSAGTESGNGGGQRGGIVVPGLDVRGNGSDSAVVVGPTRKAPAYHEPSPAEWTQAAPGKDSRRMARSMMSAALRPSSRVIAPFVESRFPNRPLYTTSFEVGTNGSMEWVIWFAEQAARNEQFTTIRPPVPWARIGTGADPVLPAGRLEIAAVIDKSGQPGSVSVLSSMDQAGREAVAKLIAEWVFLPALRNGEPITVDTLIEISFRHRP